MFKNVASQKLMVFAFDSTTNLPKTGDAANITAYVSKDYGTVTVLGDTSATEMDSTNAKGYYLFDLTQAETNADTLLFSAKSSTSNIVVIGAPATVMTNPANFTTLSLDSSGRVDVIKLASQTVSTSGTVTFPNATLASTTNITAGTIATVTTVTNQLTAAQIATGVWQDATAGDFTTASSIGKCLYIANVAPGGTGGHFIAGTNAATTITTGLTTHLIGTVDTVTTVTNQLTAAAIATGVWQDTTAGDFTTSLSVGKSIMNGVTLGTGLTVASVSGNVGGISGVTIPSTIASPTNITAATGITVSTNNDKTGYSLSTTPLASTSIVSASGTASAGAASTLTLTGASAVDSTYNGQTILITGGTGVGQARVISGYVGATKVATVSPAWSTTPDNTSTFTVVSMGRAVVDQWLGVAPLALSSQQVQAIVPNTQKVDIETIKTNPVVNAGTITFPTTATLASTTNITAASGISLAASQHVIVDSGTVTTVTNQLTAAAIATGVWTDTTAGDFTTSLSIGKSVMNGVTLGTGLTVARCTLTDTLTTYTGNTVQTGDAYAQTNSGTFGLAAIKGYVDDIGVAGAGLTALGDTRIAHLDADISSRGTSTLTQTQVTGGAYNVQSSSCVLGDARVAHLNADIDSRMATYTQPTNFLSTTFPTTTVASSAEVTSIQNNTRAVIVVPAVIERPDSGTDTYLIHLYLYDEIGNMEVPDSAPTVTLVNSGATDRSGRLGSTTGTLVNTGHYKWVYTNTSTDTLEQLLWEFTIVEGGATRLLGRDSLLVDTTAVDFTSADRTTLQAAATASALATVNTTVNTINVGTSDIQSRLPASLVSGRIDASVGAMATDTITSGALATSAVTEIQTGLATPTNITAATGVVLSGVTHTGAVIPTVTTLTNLPAITTDWLTSTGVASSAVTKIQTGLATPTNITAGTITTTTNLTNAPTNGDLTSTMKTSVQTAATASLTAASLTKLVAASGTVSNGLSDATSTVFKTNLTAIDNTYNDQLLVFTSGALAEQCKPILGYVQTNGVITVSEGFTSAPSDGVTFIIMATHVHPISQIQSGLATQTSVNTVISQTLDTAIRGAVGLGVANTDTQLNAIYTAIGSPMQAGTKPDVGNVDTIGGHALVQTSGKPWVLNESGNPVASYSEVTTVGNDVTSIKAKTDNLPIDPADASDIASSFSTVNSTLSTIAGYVDTEVAAIKAKTDNLPSDPADASDISALIDALPTAAENAAALLDYANGVETSITLKQALRLILAASAGKLSGAATTTITIRNVGDSKDRIIATVDSDGNRTAVATDLT